MQRGVDIDQVEVERTVENRFPSFPAMLAQFVLVVADFLENQVGKGQRGIECGKLAADRLFRQVDVRLVNQLMLHLGPGILKDRAQLHFTDIADARQVCFEQLVTGLDGQVD